MTHVLTIKIDDYLLSEIARQSSHTRMSKGAIVRKALIHFFDSHKNTKTVDASAYSESSLKNITQDLLHGKKPKIKTSLKNLQAKAIKSPLGLKPEEEVLHYRRRGRIGL